MPMTVALNNNLVSSSTGVKEYNVHFAGAILAALPTLMVYVVSGRYFVRGLMAGAVKARHRHGVPVPCAVPVDERRGEHGLRHGDARRAEGRAPACGRRGGEDAAEIKRLHQSLGTTIVYVTHDQIEAMTLATRIAVLKDGVLQQFGTPAEICADPANLFVADFMGSPPMNLIPATVEAGGAGPSLLVERAGGDFASRSEYRVLRKMGDSRRNAT